MTKGRASASATKTPPFIFISYSHRDGQFRERLEIHMAQLKREGVETWFDGDMAAGDELDPTIRRALKKADIFVALASPDYLHSVYCFEKEYQFALRKAQRKKLHVVVAIAKRCQWSHTKMANYVALPKDGKAIEDFSHRTRAYEQIVEGVRVLVKRVKKEAEVVVTKPSRAGTKHARGGAVSKLTGGSASKERKPPAKKAVPGTRSPAPRKRKATPPVSRGR